MGYSRAGILLKGGGSLMKYRNKRTGSVIDIKSELSGGEWEEVKESSKPPAEKKAGDKVGGIRKPK